MPVTRIILQKMLKNSHYNFPQLKVMCFDILLFNLNYSFIIYFQKL